MSLVVNNNHVSYISIVKRITFFTSKQCSMLIDQAAKILGMNLNVL